MSLRPFPAPTHRRSQPDANTARQLWRALADDARSLARGVGDPAAAPIAALELRRALMDAPDLPSQHGDALASHIDAAFRSSALAMLAAGTPERTAIAAPLLLSASDAVDALLDNVIAPYVALSRRISGDGVDDE